MAPEVSPPLRGERSWEGTTVVARYKTEVEPKGSAGLSRRVVTDGDPHDAAAMSGHLAKNSRWRSALLGNPLTGVHPWTNAKLESECQYRPDRPNPIRRCIGWAPHALGITSQLQVAETKTSLSASFAGARIRQSFFPARYEQTTSIPPS